MVDRRHHRRELREQLRRVVVDLADADALADPWWDVALALDNEEHIDDLRHLVTVASFTRPPGDRGAENVDDLLLAIEEAT